MAEEEIKENTETPPQEEESAYPGGVNLAGPEALAMLLCAVLIDLMGMMLLCFGLDDFGVLDVVGIGFIGAWMFLRTGKKNLFSKKLKRMGVASVIELIPFIGALSPSWTIAVYLELKNG